MLNAVLNHDITPELRATIHTHDIGGREAVLWYCEDNVGMSLDEPACRRLRDWLNEALGEPLPGMEAAQ